MSQMLEDRRTTGGDSGGEHAVRFESCPKRVRACFAGKPVADSTQVRTMFETGHLPVYYFPDEDVRADVARPK